jgi:hypothetical protein
MQNGPGVGPESHDDALLPSGASLGEQGVYDSTVPLMDTVEKSCCYYSHLTSGKS